MSWFSGNTLSLAEQLANSTNNSIKNRKKAIESFREKIFKDVVDCLKDHSSLSVRNSLKIDLEKLYDESSLEKEFNKLHPKEEELTLYEKKDLKTNITLKLEEENLKTKPEYQGLSFTVEWSLELPKKEEEEKPEEPEEK